MMCGLAGNARADISLFEYALNVDGTVGTTLPAGSTFDISSGLGTVQFSFSSPGAHSAFLFVDHELSETVNTFFNEVGSTSGSPASGQSWEIDEPGFVFGDIYDNFLLGALDNTVGPAGPEDISMAMGWEFVLAAGQTGVLRFLLSEDEPSGFYLLHSDPDSGESVYLSGSLSIRTRPDPGIVPEGNAVIAGSMLGAVVAAGFYHSRRRAKLMASAAADASVSSL